METFISMMKTYFIAGISEPFDQPPFCFDKMNKHRESLSITKASADSFKIGNGRILIYSSIGVQNSIF